MELDVVEDPVSADNDDNDDSAEEDDVPLPSSAESTPDRSVVEVDPVSSASADCPEAEDTSEDSADSEAALDEDDEDVDVLAEDSDGRMRRMVVGSV